MVNILKPFFKKRRETMLRTNDITLMIKIVVFICALYILLFSGLSKAQTSYIGEYRSNSFNYADVPVETR